MSQNWRIGFVLPNVHLIVPIEDQLKTIAFVPKTDTRVSSLVKQHRNLGNFINSFETCFRFRVEPTILILNNDHFPDEVSLEDLRAFRNIVAISAICQGLADQVGARNPTSVVWSDHFDFYPVFLSDKGDYFYRTSAVSGMSNSDLVKHSGRSSPRLPRPDSIAVNLDPMLFRPLLVAHRQHFRRKGVRNRKVLESLFRSLDVAFSASRLPVSDMPSRHEMGILIGLWISAFEVLCRVVEPKAKRVGWKNAIQLIKDAELLTSRSRLNSRIYTYQPRTDGNPIRCSFLQRLYLDLYDRRNDYFHGNALGRNSLFPLRKSGKLNLLHTAPLLYRYALIRAVQAIPEIRLRYVREVTPMRPVGESIWESSFVRLRNQIRKS